MVVALVRSGGATLTEVLGIPVVGVVNSAGGEEVVDSGTTTTPGELGTEVVDVVGSVAGVVVVESPVAPTVTVGACVVLGGSVARGTVEAGIFGTDCTSAKVELGAATRVVAVEIAVEMLGSGQGSATVTESVTSVPLPSETMHSRLLALVDASALAVTVKSADSPSFTRAIAGWNSMLTPSQLPSRGRIATGVARIALVIVSMLDAETICSLGVVGTVGSVSVELETSASPMEEVGTPDTDGTGGTATGDENPACESRGPSCRVCPFVASANAGRTPAFPRVIATRLTPWASRAACTSSVVGPG